MIGKGATPSFFAIANYNYTLTLYARYMKNVAVAILYRWMSHTFDIHIKISIQAHVYT